MKIGVISRGSPDYLIDIITDGLIRLYGRSGVSLDYNHRGGWGGQYIILLRGFEGPEPYDIHDAEILIASVRSVDAAKEWMKRTGRTNVAIVDGEDHHMLHDIHSSVKVYFKREYLKGKSYPSNVRPLPFAAIPEVVPDAVDVTEKVFYRGHETHHFRGEVVSALKSMGFAIPPERIEKAEYNRDLMRSLIGVCVRGNGWDTYRYWETPYFGTAMLAQRPEIVIPDDFKDGEEAVFFSGIEDFKRKLQGMLADPSGTFKIANAGREACIGRHLSIHRAKTVLGDLA